MVWIDNFGYSVFEGNYKHVIKKFGSEADALTGRLSRTEGGYFRHIYKVTVVVDAGMKAILQASYAKVAVTGSPPTNKLLFIDEEGFTWSPATGANDSTHAYGTGCFFIGDFDPKAVDARGWLACRQGWAIACELHIIAKNISS